MKINSRLVRDFPYESIIPQASVQ